MNSTKKTYHRPFFVNPLFGGADPCIALDNEGCYHYVAAREDGIYLFSSRTITDPGVPRRVFAFSRHPDGTPILQSVWAPEIHEIGGEWYIYFTASEEEANFETWHRRRMYALHSSDVKGDFGELTMLALGECMSIDGTVLQMPSGELYMAYMRNESPCRPREDDPTAHHNKIYIAKMSDPMHIESAPVLLTEPEYDWEGDICEGPFPLIHNGRIFLIYSGNAAHLVDYCIGLLTCIHPERPMERASWIKSPTPVFKAAGNVFGPGHASILLSPDRSEHWLLYHSKADSADTIPEGWNRVVNAKKIEWDENGMPIFATPAQYGEKILLPSGEEGVWQEGEDVSGDALSLSDSLQPYGSNAFGFKKKDECLCVPHSTRYPTKLLFRTYEWSDAEITGSVSCDLSEYESGLILRASYVAAGNDRMDGYLALVSKDSVTIYRVDGDVRTPLATADCALPKGVFQIGFRAVKNDLVVSVEKREVCRAKDATYASGRVGFYCDADTDLYYVDIRSLKA